MVAHHRLENALARAEELIAVGNQSAALQLLHEAIVSKWFQHNLLALDAIMLKFVELCVELRRGRMAKDGLHHYRGLSQNVNIAGLEAVIKKFLSLAEQRLDAAYNQAMSVNTLEAVEDLEDTPEDLSSVWANNFVDDSSKGKELVTPWLRFVWEAYRIILDICRHNNKLESLYKDVVEGAFTFCRKYNRKAELRRLSEILRHHLTLIVKYPSQTNGILLTIAESHQIQLELRFHQLDIATEMELWHEAFRSIEDIHGLFILARKSAKPSLVMTYYERLCRVFQMSHNYLYLAATLCKLFVLLKSRDESSVEGHIHVDASLAVLALLASSLFRDHDVTNTMDSEEQEAKNTRLAHFLGLQKSPTRTTIIKELYYRDILKQADQDVQELFKLVEIGNCTDKAAIESLLARLENNTQYNFLTLPIYQNVAARIFQRISSQEKNKPVSLEYLSNLISMPKVKATTHFSVNQFVLLGCRSGDFKILIDQLNGTVKFERQCFAPRPVLELNDANKSKSLILLKKLEKIVSSLAATLSPASPDLSRPMSLAFEQLEAEHKSNLARKAVIEKKKEMLEELQMRKEREEARERQLKLAAEREAETARLAEETAKREAQRREMEKEEIRREQAQKREEEEQRKKEEAARRANLEKMIAVVKRIDHIERAFRQEEVPFLRGDYEKQKEEDRAAYEERTKLIKEKGLNQHASDIQLKSRLTAMASDYQVYLGKLMDYRETLLKTRQSQMEIELEAAKAARREKALAQAAAKREREARAKEEEEKEKLKMAQESTTAASLATATDSTVKAYVPPSKRSVPESAARPQSTSSPFGSRSGSGGTSAFGSSGAWRRAN